LPTCAHSLFTHLLVYASPPIPDPHSFPTRRSSDLGSLNISRPHVESIFINQYPWVVTIYEDVEDGRGEIRHLALDIRFSNIANYIDEVGIGQRGYCFLTDLDGNNVYHPQQQLINAGLREEYTENLEEDGTHISADAIYTIHTMEHSGWRIVGVCYVDEMITAQVKS